MTFTDTAYHAVLKRITREPYAFQRDGIDYLVDRGGGFIWDEPGLGKTTQAIMAAAELGGPVLVVCPNSLKQWWKSEIRTICPGTTIRIAGQGGRFGSRNVMPLPRPIPMWTIVHYTGLRINEFSFRKVRWNCVILDECHYIKNRKAARTKAVMAITRKLTYRIGLSATPFGKNPADLWAQLRWMAPNVDGLRSYWRFYNTFVDYEFETNGRQRYRKVKGIQNQQLLARVMAGYGLRRTKFEVAPDLPPITETKMPIEMTKRQREVYDVMKRKTNVEIRIDIANAKEHGIKPETEYASVTAPRKDVDIDGAHTRLLIVNALARLIRLEQWLSHPWSFDPNVDGAKLEWLLEWASTVKTPVVVATRFKASAKRVAAALKPLCGHPVTGDISVGARNSVIKGWRQGKARFLVGTIDTIGIGLSFEQAHTMVCYDQLHSTTKMEQLMHRVHRITTDHPVQVIYLYCIDSTNEVVYNAFTHSYSQVEMVREFLRHVQEGS